MELFAEGMPEIIVAVAAEYRKLPEIDFLIRVLFDVGADIIQILAAFVFRGSASYRADQQQGKQRLCGKLITGRLFSVFLEDSLEQGKPASVMAAVDALFQLQSR